MKKINFTVLILSISISAFGQNIIESTGDVGIGTTTPNEPLEVAGTGRVFIGDGGGVNRRGILFQGTGAYARILAHDYGLPASVNLVLQDSGGKVGIGTTPNESLEVAGTGRVFIGDGGGVNRRGILFQGTGAYARILAHDYGLPASVNLVLQDSGGNVGIGTTNPKNKLSVNGTIWAKEVKVSLTDAADWVFEDDYELRTLEEVESFVKKNKHLPDVPSADEFRANQLNVAEMDNKLLQKIEELTLYMIGLNKQVQQLKLENKELKSQIEN